ncbi:hypothetical protein M0R45_006137 [Rubus argutus]|uniref:Uncharacterized protein n=1 Tax=Rubus argutus TaxID=59490 RepID=A0AAW1YPP8_RUBAR
MPSSCCCPATPRIHDAPPPCIQTRSYSSRRELTAQPSAASWPLQPPTSPHRAQASKPSPASCSSPPHRLESQRPS